MSHLTEFKDTYRDRSLIEAAAEKLGFQVVDGDHVRWYGSSRTNGIRSTLSGSNVEFTLKLGKYDVGFVPVNPDEDTEEVEDLVTDQLNPAGSEWRAVYDGWRGYVESDLGSNLCQLKKEMDLASLNRYGMAAGEPVVTENDKEIVIVQEIA